MMLTIHCFLLLIICINCEFNPCNLDSEACVPLIDFQVNCTCILVTSEDDVVNATDDILLFFQGWEIPMKLFEQKPLHTVFKRLLDSRILKLSDFDPNLELPPTVYQDLQMEEETHLFLVRNEAFERVVREIVEQNISRTSDVRTNIDHWCQEGECSLYVSQQSRNTSNYGVYQFDVDLVQAVQFGAKTIFAISTVRGSFNVPLIQARHCEVKCASFYWVEKRLCEQNCQQRARFDQVALTGDMKRTFDEYMRGAAVVNIREKYKTFFDKSKYSRDSKNSGATTDLFL